MDGTISINVKRVPVKLWKRVRLFAISADRDLRDIVVDALTEYLSSHESKVDHAP